jgi:tetratricopeptide (TPR) repeat protein
VETSQEFRGKLTRNLLPQLLRRVFVERRTGTLSLARPDETHHFFFEMGELRTATSSREGQRIGSFLKRRGVINDRELEEALAASSGHQRMRLGRLLVEKGRLTEAVLRAEMNRLVEEIVFSTFAWEGGDYVFRDSNGRLDPDVALDLSTAAVVVNGIRRLPESEEFVALLGNLDQAAAIAEDPTSRYQVISLAPHEALLLSRCDGTAPLRDLLKMGNRLESAKALYALLACGIIEPVATEAGERERRQTPLTQLNVAPLEEPAEKKSEEDAAALEIQRKLIRETYRRIDWISPYELLGADPHANAAELDEKYHERSRLFHPDLKFRDGLRDLGKELDVLYERVQKAFAMLSDPEERARFDREQQLADASQDWNSAPVSEDARKSVARANYLEARKLLDIQDYYGAILLLQEAIRLAPDNAEYHFRLAGALGKNKHWRERAILQYREATRLDPDRKEALQEYCEFLLESGKPEEAASVAGILVTRWPSDRNIQELRTRIGPATTAPERGPQAPVQPDGEAAPKTGRSLFSRLFGRG